MQRERCIRECRKLVEEVGAPGSAPKNRQNLFGTRYDVGLFVLALRLEQRTQAVNGRKRVRVLRAEPLAKALGTSIKIIVFRTDFHELFDARLNFRQNFTELCKNLKKNSAAEAVKLLKFQT